MTFIGFDTLPVEIAGALPNTSRLHELVLGSSFSAETTGPILIPNVNTMALRSMSCRRFPEFICPKLRQLELISIKFDVEQLE